jgi:hypothetical protein
MADFVYVVGPDKAVRKIAWTKSTPPSQNDLRYLENVVSRKHYKGAPTKAFAALPSTSSAGALLGVASGLSGAYGAGGQAAETKQRRGQGRAATPGTTPSVRVPPTFHQGLATGDSFGGLSSRQGSPAGSLFDAYDVGDPVAEFLAKVQGRPATFGSVAPGSSKPKPRTSARPAIDPAQDYGGAGTGTAGPSLAQVKPYMDEYDRVHSQDPNFQADRYAYKQHIYRMLSQGDGKGTSKPRQNAAPRFIARTKPTVADMRPYMDDYDYVHSKDKSYVENRAKYRQHIYRMLASRPFAVPYAPLGSSLNPYPEASPKIPRLGNLTSSFDLRSVVDSPLGKPFEALYIPGTKRPFKPPKPLYTKAQAQKEKASRHLPYLMGAMDEKLAGKPWWTPEERAKTKRFITDAFNNQPKKLAEDKVTQDIFYADVESSVYNAAARGHLKRSRYFMGLAGLVKSMVDRGVLPKYAMAKADRFMGIAKEKFRLAEVAQEGAAEENRRAALKDYSWQQWVADSTPFVGNPFRTFHAAIHGMTPTEWDEYAPGWAKGLTEVGNFAAQSLAPGAIAKGFVRLGVGVNALRAGGAAAKAISAADKAARVARVAKLTAGIDAVTGGLPKALELGENVHERGLLRGLGKTAADTVTNPVEAISYGGAALNSRAFKSLIAKAKPAGKSALGRLGLGFANEEAREAGKASIRPDRGEGFRPNDPLLFGKAGSNNLRDISAYKRAKMEGDVAAARTVVRQAITPQLDASIRANVKPGDVIVTIHKMEGGKNKLPAAFAEEITAQTRASFGTDIVQTIEGAHTGANTFERLVSRPAFGGLVVPGRRYWIVDDHVTLGGTIAELAAHIRRGGGIPVGAISLTAGSSKELKNSHLLAAAREQVLELKRRFGDEIRRELGIEPEHLTYSEASVILKDAKNLSQFRSLVTEARQTMKARKNILARRKAALAIADKAIASESNMDRRKGMLLDRDTLVKYYEEEMRKHIDKRRGKG